MFDIGAELVKFAVFFIGVGFLLGMLTAWLMLRYYGNKWRK